MWLFPVDHTYVNPVYWPNGYSGINPSHNSSLLVSVFIIIITIIIVLESPSGGTPLRHNVTNSSRPNNIFLISSWGYKWNRGINSSPPGQNGRHFGRRQFQTHFLEWNDRIPIKISLKCVPRSSTGNKPALIQVMDWRRTGNKPLPAPMLTQLTDAYMRH